MTVSGRQMLNESPVRAQELLGLNGTYNIDNDTCSGLMMIRSIRDIASIVSFQIRFKRHEIIEFESNGMAVLDCFDSAQGVRMQNGDKIRMMPGRMYSYGCDAESIQMLFSSRRTVSWYAMIIDPAKCNEYIHSRYPDIYFDAASLIEHLNGHTFYNELEVIFGQLTGRPNKAAAEIYYESKFNEVIAWLIEYASQSPGSVLSRRIHISENDRRAIMKVAELIRRNPGDADRLSGLASAVLMSTSKLRKDFKAVMACSISEFRNQEKLRLAITLLADTELTYRDIAERLGYKKLENFNLFFQRNMKLTPHEFREAHNL